MKIISKDVNESIPIEHLKGGDTFRTIPTGTIYIRLADDTTSKLGIDKSIKVGINIITGDTFYMNEGRLVFPVIVDAVERSS